MKLTRPGWSEAGEVAPLRDGARALGEDFVAEVDDQDPWLGPQHGHAQAVGGEGQGGTGHQGVHSTAGEGTGVAGGGLGLLGGLEQRLSPGRESATGVREPAALGGAVGQAHAQVVLEALDLTAQGRLRDAQHRGGAGDGKRALVAGGSTGIGWAIARLPAAAGARVVVTGRDEAALGKASAEGLIAVRGDVTVQADIDVFAGEVEALLGEQE